MSAGHQTNTRTCACGARISIKSERCRECQKNRFNRHTFDREPETVIPESRWDAWEADRVVYDPARSNAVDAIVAKHRSARLPWQA